jgi:hypothetical protein
MKDRSKSKKRAVSDASGDTVRRAVTDAGRMGSLDASEAALVGTASSLQNEVKLLRDSG